MSPLVLGWARLRFIIIVTKRTPYALGAVRGSLDCA
jgi:hypothetical protein